MTAEEERDEARQVARDLWSMLNEQCGPDGEWDFEYVLKHPWLEVEDEEEVI